MAEAILALYSTNSWSLFHAFKTKRNLHWIVQIFATIFAIVGTICVYWGRPTHFMTVHSVTGIYCKKKVCPKWQVRDSKAFVDIIHHLGLISLILVVIVAFNGVPAMWSFEFRKWSRIHPVYLKLFHNVSGLFAFILGKCVNEFDWSFTMKVFNLNHYRNGQFILWLPVCLFCWIGGERHYSMVNWNFIRNNNLFSFRCIKIILLSVSICNARKFKIAVRRYFPVSFWSNLSVILAIEIKCKSLWCVLIFFKFCLLLKYLHIVIIN